MERRWKFYTHCDETVAKYHSASSLHPKGLVESYGINVSKAIIEELSMQKAIDPTAKVGGSMQILDKMEWLYYTQYYRVKINEEVTIRNERQRALRISYISIVIASTTAIGTIVGVLI